MRNNFFDDSPVKENEIKPSALLVPFSGLTTNPGTSGRLVTRDSNPFSRRTNHTARTTENERRRAQLTLSVLNNVGALSALETHLCKIAPSGKLRYQTIIDSYAVSAAERIARWQ